MATIFEDIKSSFLERAPKMDEFKNKGPEELEKIAHEFASWQHKKLVKEYLSSKK